MNKKQIDISKVIQLYQQGLSLREVAKELGVSKFPIRNILLEAGIQLRATGQQPIYDIDDTFFEVINTQEKAYVLGLLFADGTASTTPRYKAFSISLTEDDKFLLIAITRLLRTNKPLNYISPRSDRYSNKGQWRLVITNAKMVEDLLSSGLSERTSFPPIPQELYPHFIRGLFDGDGCVSLAKRGDCEFYIMGTETLLKEVSNILFDADIFMCEPKHVKSGMYKIRLSGRDNLRKIGRYLYGEADVFLQRKYDKFQKIL